MADEAPRKQNAERDVPFETSLAPTSSVRVISWNINHRADAWRLLLDCDADIALLQEAAEPPAHVAERLDVDPEPWRTAGTARRWRTAVVKLSKGIELERFVPKSFEEAQATDLSVSRAGTLAAARVTPSSGEPFIVCSMYGLWESPHSGVESGWIYADASVHRLISDLSALVGKPSGHRIVAAGDLNILRGYGEHGSPYWASRYATVFDRMSALGMLFVGPQFPMGRRADPWPDELPVESDNVPTYHTNRQTPATATRQLDFVFASNGLAELVRARALNSVEEWGPSDHCRLDIDIA
ncbi:MAG: endonuclease/exonuclease/phosphatase family protein [Chloroflexota bacterium]|nr:endonuclease/exonuclease/phosphatase family protein [Chloroflexota bacterium]